MAAKRKRKPTLNQFIINKLLDNPKAIWKNKGIVSREMGFTKKLIEKYPLEAFWKALPLKFSAESLAWYISPQGWAYLKVEFAKFSMDIKPTETHNTSDSKFGEDKIISKTTRTIEDFLKYGSEKENS
jgi:hypothetical protein|tara:strand:- start:247 stop:630 length:384 start_codon:yes stop_codon:yes gene_type:complete